MRHASVKNHSIYLNAPGQKKLKIGGPAVLKMIKMNGLKKASHILVSGQADQLGFIKHLDIFISDANGVVLHKFV